MIRATTLPLLIILLGLGTQLDADAAIPAGAAQLYIGSSETSITPDQPVALEGSFRLRVSQGVHTPIMASVVIVESREGDKVVERSIMVSADWVRRKLLTTGERVTWTGADKCMDRRARPTTRGRKDQSIKASPRCFSLTRKESRWR